MNVLSSPNELSNELFSKMISNKSEELHEVKRSKSKYTIEKFKKISTFKNARKNNKNNHLILHNAETHVKSILSRLLTSIEKEEKKDRQPNPQLLSVIKKTKKKKKSSYKTNNILKVKPSCFKKKSTEESELKKIKTLKVKRTSNLNYKNSINNSYLKMNSFNISIHSSKNNKKVNKRKNKFKSSSPNLNSDMNENNEKNSRNNKNRHSFKSINSLKDNSGSNNSRFKRNSIFKKENDNSNSFSEKNNTILFSEEECFNKSKVISEITSKKMINSEKQKNDSRIKNSNISNNINNLKSRKNSYDQRDVKYIKNLQSPLKIARKNTHNISLSSNFKLKIQKEVDCSDLIQIFDIHEKSDSKKNTYLSLQIKKNISKNPSSINIKKIRQTSSFSPNEMPNKKKVKFKRTETNLSELTGLKKKCKLIREETLFKSLKEKIQKTIIIRPEDLNLNLNVKTPNNSTKKIISSKKNVNLKNFNNEKDLNKINNINEKKINNNEKNQIINLENIVTDLNTSRQKILERTISTKETPHNDNKFRKIIHRSTVYDSLDDEEEDETIDRFILYINPNSKFNLLFDGIIFFLSVFNLYNIPMYLAHTMNFCKTESHYFVEISLIFSEIFYIIDFFFGFFKAYYNFDEQLIKNNDLIIKYYLQTWFLSDLIEAIPVYLIIKLKENQCTSSIGNNSSHYDVVLHNMYYLFICIKIFKSIKIMYKNQAFTIITNKLNNYKIFNDFGELILKTFIILAFLHLGTCMLIFIGRNSYPSWIYLNNIHSKTFFDIFTCSLYFFLTSLTTVGYGDIASYSIKERTFQIVLLLIGLIAYSWTITSVSNYIIKLNEKNIKYEKSKEILDNIKLNNTLLSNSLYCSILRYLKYKNYHEKNDRNIIFECLPIGLKNLLIYEMYKPIIQNFIFFKNFENKDFIVRVILAFRPIIAIKNDVLVTEGDMLEDIMFVKKGVLSVELPLHLKNLEENINDYLHGDLLTIQKGPFVSKVGNTTILEKFGILFSNKNVENTVIYSSDQKNSYISNLKTKDSLSESKHKKNKIQDFKEKEKDRIKNTKYLRILKIRENEHFGDVLVFLEKRSPLRVRVVSKKSELFFLRKVDAINISSSYQNIWRKINQKSVFNFEQIKKSIRKIIELYCSIRGIKTFSSENIKKHKLHQKKNKRKKSMNSINISYFKMMSQFEFTKNNQENSSTSKRKKSFKNNIPNLYNLKKYYKIKSIKSKKRVSSKKKKHKDSLNKKSKAEQKLLETYNRHYKYYTDQNKKSSCELNSIPSIIKEEEIECTTGPAFRKNSTAKGFLFKNSSFQKTKSITNKRIGGTSTKTKNDEKNITLSIKESNEENNSHNENNNSIDNNIGNDILKPNSKNVNVSASYKSINKKLLPCKENNDDKKENNENSSNNSIYYKEEINNELNPEDKIYVPISQDNPLSNIKHKIKFFEDNEIMDLVNRDIKFNKNLKKKVEQILDSNTTSGINKDLKKKDDEQNKKNCNLKLNKSNETENIKEIKNRFNSNILKIENSIINYKIKSSYENLNYICKNKYIKNIGLQQKVKSLVIEYSMTIFHNLSSENVLIDNNLLKLPARKKNSMLDCQKKLVDLTAILEKKNSTEINNTKHTKTTYIKQQQTKNNGGSPKRINNSLKIKDNNDNLIDRKNAAHSSSKNKKKNLLSMINLNIQNSNQKMNNPSEFYSSYFQSLLENDKRFEINARRRNTTSNLLINNNDLLKYIKSKKEKNNQKIK